MADFVKIAEKFYVGASTDTKPAGVEKGTHCFEYDTGIEFINYNGTDYKPRTKSLAQREPFIFYPGAGILANGMVAAGTRSGGDTVTTTDADTTIWGTEVVYQPKRWGKIEGLAAGGIVRGQITIGIKSSAANPNGKLTIRIRNKDGTWTTILALTDAFALSTSEIYKTYELPPLLTTANFNAIPFGIAIGVRSDSAGNHAIARIMESSYIQGEFEPGM